MVLAVSDHDAGGWDVATLSGRAAYVAMCLSACWGVLTATGWVRAVTGRDALRVTHQALAAFALAMAVAHAVAHALPADGPLAAHQLVLPLVGGGEVRHALGVVGLELMLAAAVTAGLRGTVFRRDWVRLHRLAYVGVWLGAMHAWLGASANGHVAVVWMGGITVLTPAMTLAVLRFLPPPVLVRMGVVEDRPPRPAHHGAAGVRVAVDHDRCRHYALCQAQAPGVFRMLDDGRLRYARNPDTDQEPQVRAAARVCPVRAIRVDRRP
ncbi:ferredoxin [Actinosynnema sp. NPDC023658]|uniref:ferredoxin n=1 Tax=Actinosynnema sp. NPDC023658 TaxID=3155465 RepID=UPI0033E4565D